VAGYGSCHVLPNGGFAGCVFRRNFTDGYALRKMVQLDLTVVYRPLER